MRARLLSALVLAACNPSLRLTILEPAPVALPQHIGRLAVLDRSRPRDAGQEVLGAIEGLASGEGLFADRIGATEATRAAWSTLREAPRFEAILPTTRPEDVVSDVFDVPLTAHEARALSAELGVDGLVCLEVFDSDAVTSTTVEQVEETRDGRTVIVNRHTARRETRVLAGWRVYDGRSGDVLDLVRDHAAARTWEASGRTRAEAIGGLPPVHDAVVEVAWAEGSAYARRIAPSWVTVSRTWFGGGDPRLVEARRHVQAQDWGGAQQLWLALAEDPDPRLRGRALHDLALAAEVRGDLERAYDLAQQAAVALPRPLTRGYVAVLGRRRVQQARLQEQLGAPP